MFLGHFAVGLALKPKARRASLGTLFAAVQWLDLVWPMLVLLGWESLRIVPGGSNPFLHLEFVHFPYSHSLLTAVLWGLAFAAVYAWRTGGGRTALWLGLAVVSHWVLDWISHRPDLQLAPGVGARFGLGLWTHAPAAIMVELALFGGGVWMYSRATRARDAAGRFGFWSLVVALVAIYVASLVSPPPPQARDVAISALAMWLLVAWGAWCDRHRQAIS